MGSIISPTMIYQYLKDSAQVSNLSSSPRTCCPSPLVAKQHPREGLVLTVSKLIVVSSFSLANAHKNFLPGLAVRRPRKGRLTALRLAPVSYMPQGMY
ncbi:MAG: hypothetical protein LR017_02110 [Candidatus Pacebacteria bacterium]|nr:hypothetical protein [Candidatus Paceibacterota bacterium]